MEKKKHLFIAVTFYVIGTLAALYIGVFLMLLKPIYMLVLHFLRHDLTAGFVLKMLLYIALSGTIFGFIWCLGYTFFNHFMGTEDPNWAELNPPETQEVNEFQLYETCEKQQEEAQLQ